MIQITCKGNSAICTRTERITSGMVGLQCKFEFDSAWDGLAKTAVFWAGNEKRDVLLTGDTCTVPWEVLKTAGYQLVIGVYGTNAEGTLVIPTVYAMCGGIASGADPSGDASTDPTLPVWGQMQGMIGNLENLATASKDNLVAAINEAAQSGGGGGSAVALDTTLTQSGKAADAKAVGDALDNVTAAYVLALSTDEADAQANSDAVTAAIAEHGHVVLKPGKYPVKPGIVIDSGKLDMNGAHFYTVDYKSTTPLVYMKGEAPEICNGELEGSYDLADDEEGYEFFEHESLIFPYGVNDAYIHHMELHNNWGYCICTGTETEKTTHYVGTATQIANNNDVDFQTDAIEIPEGYKYVTASGQIGYNRIISTANVYYYFFDEGGTKLRVSNAVPKARIAIPNGAKTVKITTRLDDETFLAYNVYFTNYRESLTVSDCKFRNFHSLGLAGFEGPTNIVGCSFIESGKPRSEATPTGRATTGGVAIEDTPCPEFYMANCYSRDCAKLLMFGGYKGVVTNCIGDKIGAYRGWHLGISNCNISELYTMGSYIRVSVNGVHADGVDIKEANRKDVSGSISTNGFPWNPSLDCFDSFLVKVGNHNVTAGMVSGVLNGKIKSVSIGGIRWTGFAPAKGSHVVIDETVVGNDANYSGILGVTGDSYGIESNTAFLPNGYTIHDSTFNIDDLKTGYMTEVELSGAFQNCVFNLTGATYFKNFNGRCSNPIELTFTNCVINNADNYLFNFVPHAGGTVTFKNCTIADESKLFNGDASSMTVNIVTGGEGGVDIDASLSVEGAAADAKAVGTALAEKMPLPASAAVGQYFVVSAVDENGAVTAVQAVDKPSGGGGSGWREVIDYTVDAETNALTITTDKNGLPFNLREAVLFIEAVGNAETETFYSVVSTDQAVNVSWGSGTQLFTVPGLASKMERQNYIARFIALGGATLPVTAMKTSTSNYVDNFMPDRVSNGESCGFNGKNAGNYTKIDQLKFVSYARILNAGARVRLWGVDA